MTDSSLRIAINAQLISFAQTYRNAGVSRFTYTLLEGLSQARSDQHYTVFLNRREMAHAASTPMATVSHMEFVPSAWATGRPEQRILWEQMSLPRELRRHAIDVFHSPVNVLPPRLSMASVVTIHDLAFIRYPQYFRPARRIYQRRFTSSSARAATLIVAVSASTRSDIASEFAIPPERIRVVHPAVDDDFVPQPDPRRLAAFRESHGLPERYILFLGTLEPRKNLKTLVEAWATVYARNQDVPRLVIAGAKGWYFQPLLERVRELGLERLITFAGYVSRNEQPLWYSGAELFIYPSVYEGFGLPVVEALACGVPVVTSNVSSMPEAGGPLARLVDPSDVNGMAIAIETMLADPHMRARMAHEGPKWAHEFSASNMALSYMNIYAEAAALARERHVRRKR